MNTYKGTNKMIIGIVFGVITFWLFAQAMVNVVPAVQEDLGISLGTINIAISLSALFSGMFIVAAGGLADKIGRKKIAVIGYWLSILGSLCLVLAQGAVLLIIGRIIIGLSAAFIMPSTIALIKAYFEGADRQRALSYWSIGSWGGSGVASFAGGAIATSLGWRWIFIFSIVFALVGLFLLKDTPESKQESSGKFRFDYVGLGIFIVTMVALNILITYGADFGWTSGISLILMAVTVIGLITFIRVEMKKEVVLIDFAVFKNKAYTGATVSNFLLNAIAGTLVVANTYVQVGRGFNAFQSGLLSLGYLVTVLAMIRVGEKILQRVGAKKPMIWGGIITTVGVALMGLTFLPDVAYTIAVFVGFALFGLGLGIYATPSTDTSVSNAPSDKVGEAAGVYKMASSLGSAFGVAISMTAYGAASANGNLEMAATTGIIINVIFGVLSILSVLFLVPKSAGKSVD
ncbi:permease of the major facilitator superfamily [Solibacillus silvestris StLB046]|uniref:Permease of the major facilitator superfamily n=2 Tax=Caryophanaceae TaxID=186818 RepID=F2F5E6_SOLSS|nr:MFS transporter [Solibacillus silvestris]OBW59478.1 quinolone resistance protein [Solibacillus silvestris]BAK14729.1 permease of the major facilitator superfamily [Solibacillus silvestris StLB046]